jgi:2-polyprenyl-3-methyl-5-hydroxy-6-metoxy-1,4-benzoquinol methylase
MPYEPPEMNVTPTDLASCEVCGYTGTLHFYFRGVDRLHGVGDGFDYVRCKNCGLVSAHPIPDTDSIAAFYPSNYAPYADPGFAHRAKTSLRQRIRRQVLSKRFGYSFDERSRGFGLLGGLAYWLKSTTFGNIPYYVPAGTLLDIGCGSGSYLVQMHGLGWQVNGIELNEGACRIAESLDLDVLNSEFAPGLFAPDSFDCVVMWNVVEHLPHPRLALEEIFRILKPGGQLLLATPNIESLQFSLFGTYWFNLEAPRHLHLFGVTTLTRLIHSIGFERMRVAYCSHSNGFLESLLFVLREKIGRSFGIGERNPINHDTNRMRRLRNVHDLVSFGVWSLHNLFELAGFAVDTLHCGDTIFVRCNKPSVSSKNDDSHVKVRM